MKRLSMLGLALVMVFLSFGSAVAFYDPPTFHEDGWKTTDKEKVGSFTLTYYEFKKILKKCIPHHLRKITFKLFEETCRANVVIRVGSQVTVTSTSEVVGKTWTSYETNKRHAMIKTKDGTWKHAPEAFAIPIIEKGVSVIVLVNDNLKHLQKREFPELK